VQTFDNFNAFNVRERFAIVLIALVVNLKKLNKNLNILRVVSIYLSVDVIVAFLLNATFY